MLALNGYIFFMYLYTKFERLKFFIQRRVVALPAHSPRDVFYHTRPLVVDEPGQTGSARCLLPILLRLGVRADAGTLEAH